ncbi:MAG: putative allantoicase 1 [Planctomycetota bacterium]|nr:MAG: putative allantoicase 1 [Planctomycetota bacterium]
MSAAGQPAAVAAFADLVELAGERVGGQVLGASDEFFAPAENLLRPGRGVFVPERYTERGKWMDGWESRRRRGPGHDWCVIRLGLPGVVRAVDIDTNHFLGNHPPFASLEACEAPAGLAAAVLLRPPGPAAGTEEAAPRWREVLPPVALRPGTQNLFALPVPCRATHVRLHIYPDGGVARLRVYGEVAPEPELLSGEHLVDLAALASGGRVRACSDMFFGAADNMLLPGRAAHMGEGWETRRRRGPGEDWAIVQLGAPGRIERVEIDTHHFKGNYPERCALEAAHLPGIRLVDLVAPGLAWRELLPECRLQGDACHVFVNELRELGPVTHVRLRIMPDGGVSRLRVFGRPVAPPHAAQP